MGEEQQDEFDWTREFLTRSSSDATFFPEDSLVSLLMSDPGFADENDGWENQAGSSDNPEQSKKVSLRSKVMGMRAVLKMLKALKTKKKANGAAAGGAAAADGAAPTGGAAGGADLAPSGDPAQVGDKRVADDDSVWALELPPALGLRNLSQMSGLSSFLGRDISDHDRNQRNSNDVPPSPTGSEGSMGSLDENIDEVLQRLEHVPVLSRSTSEGTEAVDNFTAFHAIPDLSKIFRAPSYVMDHMAIGISPSRWAKLAPDNAAPARRWSLLRSVVNTGIAFRLGAKKSVSLTEDEQVRKKEQLQLEVDRFKAKLLNITDEWEHIHINLNRNSPVEGAHTSSARANTRPATPPRGAAHSSLPPPGAQAAAGRSNLNLEPNSIAALSFQPALRPLPASHASSPSMPDTSPVDGTAVTSSVPHTRPAPVFANALGAFNTNAQQPVVTFPSSSATFSGSAGMCSARRSSPVDSSTQHARSTPPQPFGGPLTQPQNTLVSSLLKQSTQPSQSMLRNTQQGILFSAPQHSRVTSFGEQNVPPNQSVPHSTPPNTLVPPVAEHNAAPDLNTHHSAPMLSPQAAPISNLPLNFENLVNNIQQFTRRNSEILNNTLLTNVQQNSRRNSDTFGNTPRCDSSAQEQASVLSPLFVTQPQPQAQQQTHFQQQPQLQQQPQFQPQPQFQQPSCTPPVTPRFSNLMFNLQNSEPVTPRFGLPQDFRVREETDLTFEAPLPTSTPYYQQGADPNYAPPQQPSFPAADPSTTGMPPQQHPTQAPPDPPAPYVPPQAAPDKLFSVAPRGPFMVKSVASGSCYLFPGLNLEGKVLDIDVLVQKCQTQAPSFRGFQILEVLLGRGEGGAQPRKRARQQNLRCSFKVMPDGSSEAITIKVWSDGKTLSHGCKHRSQLLDVNHFMKQVIQFSEMSGGSPVLSGKLKEAGMGIFSGLDQVVQGGESSTTHVEVLSAPLLGSWDLNLKMQRLKLHLDNLAQHLREPHFSDRISEVRFVPPTGNAVRFHNMSIYVRKECLSHWPAHNNEMNSIYVNVYESGKCTVLAAPSEEVANELADVVTSILHTALEQPNIRVEI